MKKGEINRTVLSQPKIQVASKYERRVDTRSYDDKKKLFEGVSKHVSCCFLIQPDLVRRELHSEYEVWNVHFHDTHTEKIIFSFRSKIFGTCTIQLVLPCFYLSVRYIYLLLREQISLKLMQPNYCQILANI